MQKALISPILVVALAAALLPGCNFMASGGGALLGNLFVLAVTVGIFFGTLGLGRSTSRSAQSTADRSQSSLQSGEQRRS